MMKQKSKFQNQKGSTEKINVLTLSESSLSESDDIFQRQSQASTSAAPADKPATTNSAVDYTLLSRTCDRYGVSDRAGALLLLQFFTFPLRKLLIKISSAENARKHKNWSLKKTMSYKYLLYNSTDGQIEL
ncbi:hypothetical protein AVEN_237329-1 [Araneus ventricosus]|uniref:Uncharacterized protein n=1 Tax=Araneus ventricosus TaxID=182803 RepID=A0A4Y2ICR7_ARAVE|nr:hypothetical protein AVEN_237329-1 [Araneus ventricosus]